MKDLKMIRATNQFQKIIDRYQKNNKKVKGKDSLNTLSAKDSNKINSFCNFSEEEETHTVGPLLGAVVAAFLRPIFVIQ